MLQRFGLIGTVASEARLSITAVAAIALIGVAPMFAHGWLAVFESSR